MGQPPIHPNIHGANGRDNPTSSVGATNFASSTSSDGCLPIETTDLGSGSSNRGVLENRTAPRGNPAAASSLFLLSRFILDLVPKSTNRALKSGIKTWSHDKNELQGLKIGRFHDDSIWPLDKRCREHWGRLERQINILIEQTPTTDNNGPSPQVILDCYTIGISLEEASPTVIMGCTSSRYGSRLRRAVQNSGLLNMGVIQFQIRTALPGLDWSLDESREEARGNVDDVVNKGLLQQTWLAFITSFGRRQGANVTGEA